MLSASISESGYADIVITDMVGRTVHQQTEYISSNFEKEFDLSSLDQGLYFVQFKMNNSQRTIRIVKN